MEKDFTSLKEALIDTFARLKELENSKNGITGISTGFVDLDYAIKGLNNSSLNIIASRPAMGKTAFALNIATNVALKYNTPVAIFSLEMSKEQCTNRILSLQAMINSNKLNNGRLDNEDWKKISEALKQLSDTEIYIDDTPGISVDKIREKCIKLKQEKNLGFIVIDYIQLISIQDNKNCSSREQEISAISLALKNLAKELNIPILITSQLSNEKDRKYLKGQDNRPTFEGLKYSGTLIQDADVIMFLYRDEYYNIETPNKEIAEVIIAKNRYGSCGTVTLKSLLEYSKFTDLEK